MGDSDVQFTLKRRASGDKWIAIGFSDDKLMVCGQVSKLLGARLHSTVSMSD